MTPRANAGAALSLTFVPAHLGRELPCGKQQLPMGQAAPLCHWPPLDGAWTATLCTALWRCNWAVPSLGSSWRHVTCFAHWDGSNETQVEALSDWACPALASAVATQGHMVLACWGPGGRHEEQGGVLPSTAGPWRPSGTGDPQVAMSAASVTRAAWLSPPDLSPRSKPCLRELNPPTCELTGRLLFAQSRGYSSPALRY